MIASEAQSSKPGRRIGPVKPLFTNKKLVPEPDPSFTYSLGSWKRNDFY